MIRVLVVDDELVVRIGIKSIVDWNSHGFQIIGEAANGEEALQKISLLNPHILLTDIKMPKMDGIDLIKAVRERYHHIKIIVLSCHNDFEFVRQAMKLGASDYILKLSMEPEQILEVMKGLKNQLDKSSDKENEAYLLKKNIDSNMDVIKQKFFKKIIDGNYPDMEDVYREANSLNIRFKEGNYLILITKICSYMNKNGETRLEPELLKQSVLNIMGEVIGSGNFFGDVYAEDSGSFVTVLITGKDICNTGPIKEELFKMVNHMHELIETYLNIHVFSGINDSFAMNLKEMNYAWHKALAACEDRFYHSKSAIIFSSEINYYNKIRNYYGLILQNELPAALKIGEMERAKVLLENIFNRLISEHDVSPQEVKLLSRQILNTIMQIVVTLNLSDENGDKIDFYSRSMELDSIDNIFKLREWFEDCLDEYQYGYYRLQKGIYTEKIEKLKQYVRENYNSGIPLEFAAGFLNVGKNYFCSIFKKEEGRTFYDYLIDMRLEKAKELLRNTNLKIYEIAESVGYTNFNYFTTLFKKVIGVSPNEYRKV